MSPRILNIFVHMFYIKVHLCLGGLYKPVYLAGPTPNLTCQRADVIISQEYDAKSIITKNCLI